MQKYQCFIWLLIAAVLQANVATASHSSSSKDPCEHWELKRKAKVVKNPSDKPVLDKILMDLVVKFTKGTTTAGDFQDTLTNYGQQHTSIFVPSFLLFAVLAIALLPVWAMCGCCESCWFKKCRRGKDDDGMFGPFIYWIIWLVSVVVLAAVVISAQVSFQRFSNGVSQTVCDVDGSMGEIADWVDGLSSKVGKLTTQIGGIIDEGQGDVTRTIDDLQITVNKASTSLSNVLDNVVGSTDAIKTAFKNYSIEFTIPGFDNLRQQANLNSHVNFGTIKSQMGDVVDKAKVVATDIPRTITYQLGNISNLIRVQRNSFFRSGVIFFPSIPVLFPDALLHATVIDTTEQVKSAVQKLVLLIYIPIFICAPPLLISGVLIFLFFCQCRDTHKCCAKFALCGSKCGCCLLHCGLFFILILSVLFLALAQFYSEICVTGEDPIITLKYLDANGMNSISSFIPKNNFTDLNQKAIMDMADQCLDGSGYSGKTSLADKIGAVKIVNNTMSAADKLISQADTVNLGQFVDDAFDKARKEIKKFEEQADGQKMPQSLISAAETTCTQCTGFKTTFESFRARYGGDDMRSFGDTCDDACSKSPSNGCANYQTTTTNGPNAPTMPPLTVVGVGADRKIRFPNGQEISVPAEIADRVAQGQNDPSAPCRMCKEKVCSLSSLGTTINTQIDNIGGNLTVLGEVVNGTAKSIKKIQDGMLFVLLFVT